MAYKKPIRNFDGIQFEELRKELDHKYNAVHDELSDAYYNQRPFREYGILSKDAFDELHGLIFLMRDVEFHEANLAKAEGGRIPESEYNLDAGSNGIASITKAERAKIAIAQLKERGITLRI